MSFFSRYPANVVDASNASVGVNTDPIPSSSTLVGGEDPTGDLQPLQTTAAGALITSPDPAGVQHVIVDSSALPTGAATEATLLALSNKSPAGLVPEAFDYQLITYIGSTTDIDQVVYKTGGAGGTTVATLTMGYDGDNRLSTVTKS